jgi:hypothetical protein
MIRSTQLRPRNWAALGELDEIVDRLFDDLDRVGPGIRGAGKGTEPVAATPRDGRRTADGLSAESPEASTDLSRPPVPSEAPGGPEERASTPEEAASALQARPLPPEDADFVARTVAWLACRPNADLLLERIRSTLLEPPVRVENPASTDASDHPQFLPDPKSF